ncbi:MAG: IS110 family transposase [Chitinophagaceae bacterium]|nr:MAG: IS110 family transposase [Chitinophagaceae bacterium]
MEKIVKQVVGIDVAQKELVVALGRMYENWCLELYAHKTFANTAKGFEALTTWVGKQTDLSITTRFVMEATGVYHESLAYYLDELGLPVSVVLPNKISNFSRTLDIKTITDKTSSESIARFGLERNLENWKRPNDVYKKLRQLSRERNQLVAERTMVKNELHAEKSEAEPNQRSIARIKKRIDLLNKQEKEIKTEISDLVQAHEESKKVTNLICSVPGVGLLTAVAVLSETNGFDLIRNKRQLASYAGLDVKDKQSGTSVKGKPRISKQGNKHLRKAMHLPALSAIRHDERFKAVFTRIVQKHGIKMKAAVAVQRKLLEMIFTVYKTGMIYDKNYLTRVVELAS